MPAEIVVIQADLPTHTLERAGALAPQGGSLCVVNPANSLMRHGAGCAAALSVAAGPRFQAWSDQSALDEGPISTGHCRMGPGFLLNARVAHVVGPRVVNRAVTLKDQQALANCVREAVLQAEFEGLVEILIPAVSSGLFGFPKNLCASILVQTALSLAPRLEAVRRIAFVNNDEFTTKLFVRALNEARGIYEDASP